jgi:hypothetical protein
MMIDTALQQNHIYGICSKCLNRALALPENRTRSQLGIPAWDKGECDVCHKIVPVAPVSTWGFPVINVKRQYA